MKTQHWGKGARGRGRGNAFTHAPCPMPHAPSSGFSLVEVMVAVGVFGIIGAAIVAVSGAGHQFWAVGDAATQVQMNFRRALGYLQEDLKEAKASQTIPSDGIATNSVITFKVPIDTEGDGNVLKDSAPEWGADGLATAASTTKNIRYALEDSGDGTNYQLVRCVVPDTPTTVNCTGAEDRQVVSNRLSPTGIRFSKSSRLLTVALTIQHKARTSGAGSDAGWEPKLNNMTAQIHLRN